MLGKNGKKLTWKQISRGEGEYNKTHCKKLLFLFLFIFLKHSFLILNIISSYLPVLLTLLQPSIHPTSNPLLREYKAPYVKSTVWHITLTPDQGPSHYIQTEQNICLKKIGPKMPVQALGMHPSPIASNPTDFPSYTTVIRFRGHSLSL